MVKKNFVKDYYKKYGLVDTEIDFDMHLDKDDLDLATEIIDGIKHIEIKNCQVEFGFEEDLANKENIIINLGFAGVTLKKEDFEEAVKRYHLRDIALMEIKKTLKKAKKKDG